MAAPRTNSARLSLDASWSEDGQLNASFSAELRQLVSSSELARLCASTLSSDRCRSWHMGASGQARRPNLLHATTRLSSACSGFPASNFAQHNLSPQDMVEWRMEQARLEMFAAQQLQHRHQCSSGAAPLTTASGRRGMLVYAGQQSAPRCEVPSVSSSDSSGSLNLAAMAAYAGLPALPTLQIEAAPGAAPSPNLERNACDLARRVAELRSPGRLQAIQHCLNDPQTSPAGVRRSFSESVQPEARTRPHASGAQNKRRNHRAEQTLVLRDWFEAHSLDPYPSTREKYMLAKHARMDVKQVENWFTNRRKRNWRYQDEKAQGRGQALDSLSDE